MTRAVATTAFIVFISCYVSAYHKVIQRFRHYDFVMTCPFRNAPPFHRRTARLTKIFFGRSIARDDVDFGLPLLDLISEGKIGLMEAVGRFDPGKGSKLSTYASWWIKWAIKRVRQAPGACRI